MSGFRLTQKYQEKRRDLSDRLRALVKSIENSWLGFEKASLLGSLADKSDREMVEGVIKDCIKTNLVPTEAEYLASLVSASPCLSGDQLMEGMTSRLENIPEDEIISLTKTAKTDLKSL